MPYELIEQDVDLECDRIFCGHNEFGYCSVEENVSDLLPNEDNCRFNDFSISKKEKFFVKNKNFDFDEFTKKELEEIFLEYGYLYCELNPKSDTAFVKKNKNLIFIIRADEHEIDEFLYWPHVEGGVGFTHKSQTIMNL